ncbi:MAG: ABC transporter permease [Flavobacteriales bacterium]
MAVKRNPTATIGAAFIALMTLVALLGPVIRPDPTPNANTQQLSISRQKPGFQVNVIQLTYADGRTESIPIDSVDTASPNLRILPFGDDRWMEPEAAQSFSVERKRFWLGTDTYGRDFLSRLMAGSAISLSVGFVAVLISLLIGVVLGALSGYFGGWMDAVISWFINVVWSIPTLLMVIAITLAFGKGFWQVFVAIGLTMWVEVARIVRGQFLSLREKEYVEAAKALGYSHFRIIRRHIMPNAIGPVIVICAANFASAILIEAGLSFLGLGAQIPVPSWGNMIKEHYPLVTTDLAYLALLPGFLIMALVLSFMLIGNGLRDRLDVRR